MNLTEATILALQGKLLKENTKIEDSKSIKTESVEVATDDTIVNVGDEKTEIITDEETITVEKQHDEAVEEEVIDEILPEESEDVGIDDIPVDDISLAITNNTEVSEEEVKPEEEIKEDETNETEEEVTQEEQETEEVKEDEVEEKEKVTENVDIHVDSETEEVTITTDGNEDVAVISEEPVCEEVIETEEVVEEPVEEIVSEEVVEEQPEEEVKETEEVEESKELKKESLYITEEIDSFEELKDFCKGEAAQSTLKEVERLHKEDELMNYLEDILFGQLKQMSATELNDIIAYDDSLPEVLGLFDYAEEETKEVVKEAKLEESSAARANKLIELCEEQILSWETVARELIAEASEDDLDYTFRMLDIDLEDEEDEEDKEELDESCKKEEAKEKLNFLSVDKLPEMCYGLLPSDNSIIVIKKGESGYFQTDFDKPESEEAAETEVKRLNDQLGVTPDQRFTMELRSLSGNWHDKIKEILEIEEVENKEEDIKFEKEDELAKHIANHFEEITGVKPTEIFDENKQFIDSKVEETSKSILEFIKEHSEEGLDEEVILEILDDELRKLI